LTPEIYVGRSIQVLFRAFSKNLKPDTTISVDSLHFAQTVPDSYWGEVRERDPFRCRTPSSMKPQDGVLRILGRCLGLGPCVCLQAEVVRRFSPGRLVEK
jgi:hypothetical protein